MSRTYLYSFNYSIDGVFTELPLFVSVRGVTMRDAHLFAHAEVRQRIMDGYGKDDKQWATTVGFTIYYPGQRERIRPVKNKKATPRDFAFMERFAKAVSPAILKVINSAPPMSDLFNTPTL